MTARILDLEDVAYTIYGANLMQGRGGTVDKMIAEFRRPHTWRTTGSLDFDELKGQTLTIGLYMHDDIEAHVGMRRELGEFTCLGWVGKGWARQVKFVQGERSISISPRVGIRCSWIPVTRE